MGAAARVAPMSVGLGREEVVGRRRRGGAGACMLDVSDDLRRAAHCHTPDQGRWGDQTEVLPAAWLRGVCGFGKPLGFTENHFDGLMHQAPGSPRARAITRGCAPRYALLPDRRPPPAARRLSAFPLFRAYSLQCTSDFRLQVVIDHR
jgi:hypothetical protein